MELAKTARPVDRRSHYRFWWEYLRLAHQVASLGSAPYRSRSDTQFIKDVKSALESSKKNYDSWNMKENEKFNDWWKKHSHLFEEQFVVRELKHCEAPHDADAIVIEVPLRFSAANLTAQTQAVIRAAMDRREPGGKSPKNKKKPSAKFAPSQGSELRELQIKEMLTIYRDVEVPNIKGLLVSKHVPKQLAKLTGGKLLVAVNDFYANRKPESWGPVPGTLQVRYRTDKNRKKTDRLDASANATPLKSLRRYIKNAEKIILNVARGEFPGRY